MAPKIKSTVLTRVVQPFFHVKFVMKWGVGLYRGAGSDTKITKLNIAQNTLFNLVFFVCVHDTSIA